MAPLAFSWSPKVRMWGELGTLYYPLVCMWVQVCLCSSLRGPTLTCPHCHSMTAGKYSSRTLTSGRSRCWKWMDEWTDGCLTLWQYACWSGSSSPVASVDSDLIKMTHHCLGSRRPPPQHRTVWCCRFPPRCQLCSHMKDTVSHWARGLELLACKVRKWRGQQSETRVDWLTVVVSCQL